MTLVFFAGGLLLLLAGGDLLVRGAVRVATALGVSPLLIGLTLVGFGTSTPELVTSLRAAQAGSPGIALGNVIGSNICNVLLILGMAAVVQPITTTPGALRRDGSVVLAASVACILALVSGELGRAVGGVLFLMLLAYLVGTFLLERQNDDASSDGARHANARFLIGSAGLTLGGISMIVLGAGWVVEGAISLATTLGVSETLIGLTIVAVGTSLPELVTSVLAALHRQSGLAFGNVVGSNIFNILGILGLTALVAPIPVPAEILRLDAWVMLASTAALILFAATGSRVSRWEGGVFLVGYGAYLGLLAAQTI